MKKWKQRGFAFVLALSLTTGLLTGAQAAVSKETLNEAVQDTAEYMYRTVQNPQVGSIGGEWAVLGLARVGTMYRTAIIKTTMPLWRPM